MREVAMSTKMLTEKPILLTTIETTRLLKTNRARVYDLIAKEVIHGFRVGADWRIRTDSVEAYLGRSVELTEIITLPKSKIPSQSPILGDQHQ
jgi:excisionase family DNA binding protein